MEDKLHSVPALEKKYSHDILLSLLAHPRQKKTDLLQSISKSSSMPRRLDELEEAGLVIVERDTYDYNTKWVRLSERGIKVAELLSLIHFEVKRNKWVNSVFLLVLSIVIIKSNRQKNMVKGFGARFPGHRK